MPAFIHHVATGNPPHRYDNAVIRDRMKRWIPGARAARLIDMVYRRSGIETRHSATGDFARDDGELFRLDAEGRFVSPPTGRRNAAYGPAARVLAADVARRAIAGSPGLRPEQVTHVVFATCTGFVNPGPDYHIIRELGLRPDVQRYTVGFMGCYAAFPALRMAADICEADSSAVVLVVCLELCTLHVQVGDDPESITSNSLFADGAAATVVSSRPPGDGRPFYRIKGFRSALVPSSEEHMAWTVGDHGFDMVLSSYVPDLIGKNVRGMLDDALGSHGLAAAQVGEWAVHPGGRAILDEVQSAMGLPADALEASRNVLRDYGNMSSPTVLFVLKRLMERPAPRPVTTCAVAFGPGLTVETAVLERVGVPAPALAGTLHGTDA